MLTKALCAVALALGCLAGPAWAQEAHLSCFPFAMMKHSIEEAGGHIVELTTEQFQFARGVFVGSPPASHELPPGDRAVMGVLDNGGLGLLFIDGELSCDAGSLSPAMRQMIVDVGAGNFTHVGTSN